MRSKLAAVLAVSLLCATFVWANLLLNPGFESGTGNDADNWWRYNEAGRNDWAWRNGSYGMGFWNWGNGIYGGFGQDVSSNFVVGEVVQFSVYGFFEPNYTSTTKETWMKLEYWTNGGATWTLQSSFDVYDTLAGNRSAWNLLSMTETVNLQNVVMIKPIVGFGGGTNLGLGTSGAKWDDADFVSMGTAIPEPMSLMLVGLGLYVGLLVRRAIRK